MRGQYVNWLLESEQIDAGQHVAPVSLWLQWRQRWRITGAPDAQAAGTARILRAFVTLSRQRRGGRDARAPGTAHLARATPPVR